MNTQIAKLDLLTHRELAVVALLAGGLTNKEIGRSLGVLPETVKTHLKSVFAKLECHSRVAVVALYVNWTLACGGVPSN